jgi:hypothetical protein
MLNGRGRQMASGLLDRTRASAQAGTGRNLSASTFCYPDPLAAVRRAPDHCAGLRIVAPNPGSLRRAPDRCARASDHCLGRPEHCARASDHCSERSEHCAGLRINVPDAGNTCARAPDQCSERRERCTGLRIHVPNVGNVVPSSGSRNRAPDQCSERRSVAPGSGSMFLTPEPNAEPPASDGSSPCLTTTY